jgi:arginase family enzyme
VVGSLDELRPDAGGPPFADPDHPDEAAVADAAVESVVALLTEVARLHGSEARLQHELGAAYDELERARSPWFRVKRRLVLLAGDHRVVAAGLAGYRRVRGRSSRSA